MMLMIPMIRDHDDCDTLMIDDSDSSDHDDSDSLARDDPYDSDDW